MLLYHFLHAKQRKYCLHLHAKKWMNYSYWMHYLKFILCNILWNKINCFTKNVIEVRTKEQIRSKCIRVLT